jgi:hypothetical protein
MAGLPEKAAATQSSRKPSAFVSGSTYHYNTCWRALGRSGKLDTPDQDRTADLQRVRRHRHKTTGAAAKHALVDIRPRTGLSRDR